MGTKLAPALATLVLSIIEEDYINKSACKPIFRKRYVHDIFLIWDGTREQLDCFISGLN